MLFASFVFLTIFFYLVMNRDIMSPTVIMGLSYILAIIAAIYNINNWKINLGIKTCVILLTSYVVFAVVEIAIKYLWVHGRNAENTIFPELKEIVIPKYMICIYLVFVSVITFLYYIEIFRIATMYGFSGTGNFLTYYRNAASYGVLTLEEDVNQIINQLFKLVTIGAYIFLYILLNNLIAVQLPFREKWRKYFWLRVPIYFFLVASLLTANRLQYIRFAVAGFVMTYLLWNCHWNWTRHISGKIVVWGIVTLVVLLISFVLLRSVVGRISNQTPVDYITRYAGAAIELFDQYVKKPIASSDYFGEETFYGLYTVLRKLGLSSYDKIGHLEFRRLGNYGYASNTYTAIRRYYRDFGMLGIVVFVSITSLFYSIFYYYQLRKPNKRTQYKEILYAFMFYAIPMYSINELFFSSYISVAFIVYCVELWLLWFVVTKIRFVRR